MIRVYKQVGVVHGKLIEALPSLVSESDDVVIDDDGKLYPVHPDYMAIAFNKPYAYGPRSSSDGQHQEVWDVFLPHYRGAVCVCLGCGTEWREGEGTLEPCSA